MGLDEFDIFTWPVAAAVSSGSKQLGNRSSHCGTVQPDCPLDIHCRFGEWRTMLYSIMEIVYGNGFPHFFTEELKSKVSIYTSKSYRLR